MSKVKIGLQVIKSRYLSSRKPLIVGWKLLNRCNQKCLYCNSWSDSTDELTTERIFDIISQMREAGVIRISYTGGEPLLHKDIGKILDETKRNGIFSILTTNGQLIPQRLDELSSADKIIISYDGPEDVHDKVRGEHTHSRVLQAIDAIRERLCAGIELRCVLTVHNIERVAEILDFSQKKNIPVGFSIVQSFPFSSSAVSSLLPEEEDVRKQLDFLIRSKEQGNRFIISSLPALYHLRKWPVNAFIPCAGAKLFCRIDSQGDILSCGKYLNTKGYLNCRQNDFLQAFSALHPTGCGQCWCDNKIDINLIYSLNCRAIFDRISDL